MKPESALDAQIERYRQMTGEERLCEGFRLTELYWTQIRERMQGNCVGISEAEFSVKLHEHRRELNRLHPT